VPRTETERLMTNATIELRIHRQDGPDQPRRWEEFSIPDLGNMNVISCLMEIQKNPVTRAGERTTPPAWEQNCLENVCGSCTMLVNGRPVQACATLVADLARPLEIRPLTKFPVVRDLMVDRQRMFDLLRKVQAWVPIDGTHDLGPGPAMPEEERLKAYTFSRCMTCGCCMEHGGLPAVRPRAGVRRAGASGPGPAVQRPPDRADGPA